MNDDDVRAIDTAPISEEGARELIERFFVRMRAEGANLRAESVINLCGMRVVLVADWDDMG